MMSTSRKEYQHSYYRRNKEKRQEYFKTYYQNNKEKIKARNNKRYAEKQEVKESQKDRYKRYYEEHKEERKRYRKFAAHNMEMPISCGIRTKISANGNIWSDQERYRTNTAKAV